MAERKIMIDISKENLTPTYQAGVTGILPKVDKLNAFWKDLVHLMITVDTSLLFGSFVLLEYKDFSLHWTMPTGWVGLLLAILLLLAGLIDQARFMGIRINQDQGDLRQILVAIQEQRPAHLEAPNFIIFSPIIFTVLGFFCSASGIIGLSCGLATSFYPEHKCIVLSGYILLHLLAGLALYVGLKSFWKSEKQSKNI